MHGPKNKIVELYLYSLSGPVWPATGWNRTYLTFGIRTQCLSQP